MEPVEGENLTGTVRQMVEGKLGCELQNFQVILWTTHHDVFCLHDIK